MKQTSVASKYPNINMDDGTVKRILRDMRSGLTEKAVIEKYRHSSSQYQNLRTVLNESTGPGSTNQLNEKGIELENLSPESAPGVDADWNRIVQALTKLVRKATRPVPVGDHVIV